jgi:serine/threonine protein kinase
MSLLGEQLGEYEIVQEIGRGGMADVYLAYQHSLDRSVAIKVLPPEYARDSAFVDRFLREARTAAGLEHPHIVPIYEADQQAGLYYIVMRYLEGETLKELIERQGPLPLPRVLRIVGQLAEALDYAHSQDVTHRDVKPSNIFTGQNDHVTLADFGIARAGEATRLTRTGTLLGTPEYMSPEQAKGGEIDWRTDIYSLGITVYEMLTGRVPFRASTPHGVLHAQIYEQAPAPRTLNPALPLGVDRALARALAKQPDERYSSAMQFARALSGQGNDAKEPAVSLQPHARLRTKALAATLGLVCVAIVAVLGVSALAGLRGGRDPSEWPTSNPTSRSAVGTQPAVLAVDSATPSSIGHAVETPPETAGPSDTWTSTPLAQSPDSTPTPTHSQVPATPTDARTLIAAPPGAGGLIAFVSDPDGNREIYVVHSDGSLALNLTRNTAADEHPAWSPDGTWIAFASNRDGDFEIYRMTADGTEPRNLSQNPSDDWGPSWSPDGAHIAYMSWRENNNEIYVSDADGDGQRRLTSNQAEDHWPSWSPDGAHIAFMSDRDGNWEIYVMNADGSGQENLTRHWSADFYPAWSPDSRHVAFVSDRDGNEEIYVVNADGTGATNLSNHPADDWAPSWSPDGRLIAFVSGRGGQADVYIMQADGTGQEPLIDDWPADNWDPSWSPQ